MSDTTHIRLKIFPGFSQNYLKYFRYFYLTTGKGRN